MIKSIGFLGALLFLLIACETNKKMDRKLHFSIDDLTDISYENTYYSETIYVPVYTDVYHVDQSRLFPLTITLSMRNTSLTDTINIYTLNYYNSEGELKKKHIEEDKMLQLHPLQSYELVINKTTYTGDTGANFIVEWGGEKSQNSLLTQALMINTSGQQGLSFITEGTIIESKMIKPNPNE